MTDANLEIWNTLGKTDPAHTKGFDRPGGFTGTAVKPMWVIKRLTEQFGPCGKGWGVGEPSFQVVPAEGEILVYCKVSCWHGTKDNLLHGVGGDKVLTQRKSGPFRDDEAFKKAFTDAVMNAFKFIGVAADVHMGLFDDSKYVAAAKAEFAGEAAPKNPVVSVHPDGPDWWGAEGNGMSAAQAKKEGWGDKLNEWRDEIEALHTAAAWRDWCNENSDDIKRLPKGWRIEIREWAEARGHELGAINPTDRKAA